MKTHAVERGGCLCLEGDASDLRELWPLDMRDGRERSQDGTREGKKGEKGIGRLWLYRGM